MSRSLTFERIMRRLRRIFIPGAVILTYHRVVELGSDTCALCVRPENFAKHMDYLKETCNVVRLNDLARALRNSGIPRRTVVITFDDGYIDVLRNAFPILRERSLPATVFVASAHIGATREFWWDELERIIICPENLPASLNLNLKGQKHFWDVMSSGDRKRVFWNVHRMLKPLPNDERFQLLDELAEWAGVGRTVRSDYRTMTAAELAELTSDGLIDIGAHTVKHATLSKLSPEKQRLEIVAGRDRLVECLNRPVEVFAYPYGEEEDFTEDTVEIVRAAGFSVACTMIAGSVEAGDDLCRLRRRAVYDWDLRDFKHKLGEFLSA